MVYKTLSHTNVMCKFYFSCCKLNLNNHVSVQCIAYCNFGTSTNSTLLDRVIMLKINNLLINSEYEIVYEFVNFKL